MLKLLANDMERNLGDHINAVQMFPAHINFSVVMLVVDGEGRRLSLSSAILGNFLMLGVVEDSIEVPVVALKTFHKQGYT